MGKKQTAIKRFIKNYSREITAAEIRVKIIRLMLEDRERGIVSDASLRKEQNRDIYKNQQG